MKSNYIHLKNPLCHYCHKTVVAGTRRTVLDDNGSLAITAWTCGECGSVNEEIGILSENGQVIPRPNRYVVAPRHRLFPADGIQQNFGRKTATMDGISRSGSHVRRCRVG